MLGRIEPRLTFIDKKIDPVSKTQNLYEVLFYKYGKRVSITVNDKLPVYTNSKKNLLFCHQKLCDSSIELLFGIFEKAAAK